MLSPSFDLILRRSKLIILSGFVFAVAAFLITLLFPLEYRADAQVLIISRSRYGVDPYTVVKSAERVGENIAQIVKTNDFFNKVFVQPGYNLDRARFENIDDRTKRKRWEKAIDASVVYGTGVLNISGYSTNKDQASQLAAAASNALVSSGWEYVGGDVSIKLVNDPIVTRFPARPNMVVNVVAGFLLGVVVLSLVILRKGRQV